MRRIAVLMGLFAGMVNWVPPSPASLPPVSGGHDALGAPVPATEWLFAEGYTGPGFQEYLTVANPGDAEARTDLAFSFGAGAPSTRALTVPAHARATLDVNQAVGAGREVSVRLTSSVPVVAERPMYFAAGVGAAGLVDGGHVSVGATTAGLEWHFAEGFTGDGFQEYVTIQNPQPGATTAHLAFSFPDGSPRLLDQPVAGLSRVTVDVVRTVGAGREVSVSVRSDSPTVVERPVYFSRTIGAAGAVDGGHVVLGAPRASTSWLFAEGFTGDGYQEYVTVLNPGPSPVHVDTYFRRPDGSSRTAALDLPPTSRGTIDANAVLGPGVESGLEVRSALPVVAERSMYFAAACGDGCVFRGGHDAMGATAPSTMWYFAEGYTGNGPGGRFREYLTVLNPGPSPVSVPVTFLLASGSTPAVTVTVGANSRATIDVAAAVGDNQEVGIRLGPATGPVVAERAMYFTTFPGLLTDPTVMAAGDIACDGGAPTAGECHQRATSDLLVAGHPSAVLVLGDAQYDTGSLAAFQANYDPTWGRVKAITRPAAGNHEYGTAGAAGYFAYFGAAAAGPSGWYSYDLGRWHVVVLNSNCAAVGCGPGSAQEQWLRADLAAHPARCTLAYWHHPRWSSGLHGSDASLDAFWRALHDGGADVVLSGHDHTYERFAPQTPDGSLDAVGGIREFVVGTGGRSHYGFSSAIANSEVRNDDTFGVLSLTLHPAGYDWRFLPEAGAGFTDSGSTACH